MQHSPVHSPFPHKASLVYVKRSKSMLAGDFLERRPVPCCSPRKWSRADGSAAHRCHKRTSTASECHKHSSKCTWAWAPNAFEALEGQKGLMVPPGHQTVLTLYLRANTKINFSIFTLQATTYPILTHHRQHPLSSLTFLQHLKSQWYYIDAIDKAWEQKSRETTCVSETITQDNPCWLKEQNHSSFKASLEANKCLVP